MKKVIVILIIIIIILAAVILINLFLHKNYLDANTFEDVRYVYNYENLKSAKGEPVREMAVGIAEDDQIWLVVYDDITVEYMYIPEKKHVGYFLRAQTDNDAYVFGNEKIAVGMSREQVEKILKNAKRPKPTGTVSCYYNIGREKLEQPQIIEEYFDDSYEHGLGFVYGENDCVEYIYIYNSTM